MEVPLQIETLLPKSARGHVGLADVYLANNQLDQAQRSIDRALELSPGLPEAQAQSAVVALRRNRPDAAIAIAREMQKARPTEAVAQVVHEAPTASLLTLVASTKGTAFGLPFREPILTSRAWGPRPAMPG